MKGQPQTDVGLPFDMSVCDKQYTMVFNTINGFLSLLISEIACKKDVIMHTAQKSQMIFLGTFKFKRSRGCNNLKTSNIKILPPVGYKSLRYRLSDTSEYACTLLYR